MLRCYWHLDTRPDEHRRMSGSGWMGRLKLAARAIDLRLKAVPQTKDANWSAMIWFWLCLSLAALHVSLYLKTYERESHGYFAFEKNWSICLLWHVRFEVLEVWGDRVPARGFLAIWVSHRCRSLDKSHHYTLILRTHFNLLLCPHFASFCHNMHVKDLNHRMDSDPPANIDNRFSKRPSAKDMIAVEIGLKMVCFVFAPFCLKLLDESPQVAIRFVMAMPREPTSSTPVVMEAPEISSKKSRENHHVS